MIHNKYAPENYVGYKFIKKKMDLINRRGISRKSNHFLARVNVLFNEIEKLSDKDDSVVNRRKYCAKALKTQLEFDLYHDIIFDVDDKKLAENLKDELYGYLKFRASKYKK